VTTGYKLLTAEGRSLSTEYGQLAYARAAGLVKE